MSLTPDHKRHPCAFIFLFTVDTLLKQVRGDGNSSSDEPEVKYALIGAGIGLIFAACFIAVKVCMIKRHMLDNEPSEDSFRRPSLQYRVTEMDSRIS
ncbi:transmembrane protein 273 isoform X2 [Astyanax mexicanus]|uniref:Transmembrane protein 273 n=1 Tax=Astyanax mexicanus TaxID=7994 RepID=A0A8T2L5Y1_ASTMX|nr:transmembrane protein 273 isoform X2 [Astyanax mexicanus]KAG9267358.1 hypothetical protein AMEX_G18189 [Astyanax mexicanus]